MSEFTTDEEVDLILGELNNLDLEVGARVLFSFDNAPDAVGVLGQKYAGYLVWDAEIKYTPIDFNHITGFEVLDG